MCTPGFVSGSGVLGAFPRSKYQLLCYRCGRCGVRRNEKIVRKVECVNGINRPRRAEEAGGNILDVVEGCAEPPNNQKR